MILVVSSFMSTGTLTVDPEGRFARVTPRNDSAAVQVGGRSELYGETSAVTSKVRSDPAGTFIDTVPDGGNVSSIKPMSGAVTLTVMALKLAGAVSAATASRENRRSARSRNETCWVC